MLVVHGNMTGVVEIAIFVKQKDTMAVKRVTGVTKCSHFWQLRYKIGWNIRINQMSSSASSETSIQFYICRTGSGFGKLCQLFYKLSFDTKVSLFGVIAISRIFKKTSCSHAEVLVGRINRQEQFFAKL